MPIDDVRGLLQGLDRRQRQAVTHAEGPMLVVAGPGTGKTEVITRRVAWLIATRRARPSDILALTFTERAADEMQARVDLLLPYGQVDTNVHTFHAIGDALIREHGHEIGLPSDPRVIDRAQAIALLREHLFDMDLDRYRPLGDPTRFLGALVDLFSRAKESGISADELETYARELAAGAEAAGRLAQDAEARSIIAGLADEALAYAELSSAYAAYQRLLTQRNLVDHGDQVAQAVRLLEQRASVREQVRRRFPYVVVDEAQDANPQQLRLVELIVGSRGEVTFVGDDDQAIYAFRGAVGEGLAALPDTYPSITEVVLRRNYRSRAPILHAARRLIRHNDPDRLEVKRGIDKTLTAVRRSKRPAMVTHRAYPTATAEADAVAAAIAGRLEAGATPGSIAVLVRSNVDAAPLLSSLAGTGIPHRFSGASGLLGHREVRDTLSLMRVIAAPNDSEDLYSVLTSAAYGVGGSDMTSICESATRRRRSLWSVVEELQDQPGLLKLGKDTRARLRRAVREIRSSIEASHVGPAPAVLYQHLRTSGWLQTLIGRAEDGDDGPLRRVARLFEIVKDQSDLLDDPRMAPVVTTIDSLLDAGSDPVSVDHDDERQLLSVLTVHQAKGLEFDTVYVIGVSDGRFPVRQRRQPLVLPPALTGETQVDRRMAHEAEERRLLYVAMTRARDELILSHAMTARRGGRRSRPSKFLSEALGVSVDDAAEPDDPLLLEDPSGPPAVFTAPRVPGGQTVDLSFTQIDDYLNCPLKFRLRHQLRVPVAPHHALIVGRALHQAVAGVNLAQQRGKKPEGAEAIAALDANWTSEGFLSQEHEQARYAAGRAALLRFLARSQEDTESTIVAVERPFSVRIGEHRVRGRYDAIRRTPEGVIVTDYKSGDVGDQQRARQRARDSLQLRLYSLAYEAEEGQLPDAVELHFLEGDVIGRVRPTRRQLDGARSKVVAAAEGIRAGRFEPTPGFPACEWCPYRRVCPASA